MLAFFVASATAAKSYSATCVLFVLLLAWQTEVIGADDWPQWRGPTRNGRSTETELLTEWHGDGPKKLWHSQHAGLGYSGTAVVGERLFTLGQEGETEFAVCLNTRTGEQVWRQEIGKGYKNGWGDGPRSTPTVAGDRVFCLTARGTLTCLNVDGGELVWATEMKRFGGRTPFWGYSESPLVDGEHVFCTPGGKQGSLLGLNKKTGEKIWQCEDATDQAHYSSIIAADLNGKRQLIQLLQSQVVGVDASTGEILWNYDWSGKTAVIPTPIFSDGVVYVSSGYGVGSAGIRIGANNQVTELFNNKVMKNHHGGMVEVGGFVYGYSDNVGFVCQALDDGRKVWGDKELVGKGALAWADDRFYHVQEDDGEIFLLQANPTGLTKKGSFTLSPQSSRRASQGRVWVHPAISDGRLYLRDQEFIYCYEIKEGR